MAQNEQQTPSGSAAEAAAGGPPSYQIHFYIEEPAGIVYSAEASSTTLVRDVATDFFEERGWPTQRQRAVVELIDSENPERTERMNPNQTLHDAGVRDNDTLRILPESVAGIVNPQDRLQALVVDQREVLALAAADPEHITVDTNVSHAPTCYEVTLRYPGVRLGDHEPELTHEHRLEILLPADYPLVAPRVRWLTPIFHPNIRVGGTVCLGVLAERYLPGLGLAYIVRMLIDIARYRNYDLDGVYNPEAAHWVRSAEGQATITKLGGMPLETPIHELIEQARRFERDAGHKRTHFERFNRYDQDE